MRRLLVCAAVAVGAQVITARASMPSRMLVIAQTPAMRSAMPSNTAAACCICCGNARKTYTDGENNCKEFCHSSISHKRRPLQNAILPAPWRITTSFFVKNRQPCDYSHARSARRRAASQAKYVRMPLTPARLKPIRLSRMTLSRSSQPRSIAACSIEYSPDTW